ncbi:MAG: hypothetical protein ACI3ZN_06990, partial [Candidatus Cryptobacteroides sp.]
MNKTKSNLIYSAFAFFLILCALPCCTPISVGFQPKPDEEVSLTSEQFYANRDGLNIYCLTYRPENSAGKLPTVILSHSNSLTHTAMDGYAQDIPTKGF